MGRDLIQALPYFADASVYFERLRDLPWPVWLDSGRPVLSDGRYDILLADPIETVSLDAQQADEAVEQLRRVIQAKVPTITPHVPFCGGWVGYLGYELGRAWMGLPVSTGKRLAADFRAAWYDWAVVVDHHRQTAVLVSAGYAQQTYQQWQALCDRLTQVEISDNLPILKPGQIINKGLPLSDYQQSFARIQDYIHAGDIYQVGFTQRFMGQMHVPSDLLYRYLRQISPAPYGAYLGFPDYQILSNSPEQFVALQADQAITRPIKGTRPRGKTPQQDTRLQADLVSSVKDRAENLMIVDLLRNDLGRVCQPGSIAVPELFHVASYATVHHLVSTVTGQLHADKDAVDVLQACFPGGSITGAPKLRAMQIIDELETHSRELYCGSVFRLGYDGNLDSNISIRTLLKADNKLYYWAGGGIVADSQVDAEYQESLDKSAAFFSLLNYHA